MLSQVPTTKIDSTVSVVEARVSTAQIAHHDSTGICAPSSLADDVVQPATSASMREIALHQRDVAECVRGALGKIAVVALDLALAGFGLAQTSEVSPANTRHSAISSSASRQFRNSDSGSSTSSETNAARCSRKKPSQSHHSESVPASMTFISRPEWMPPWKLSGSCRMCSK